MSSAVPSPSEPGEVAGVPGDARPAVAPAAGAARAHPSAAGRGARVVIAVGVVGALLVSGLPLCPFAFLSGLPCPGCGLTRAGLCLLRGDVLEAMRYSPLAPIVVPFVGVVAGRSLWLYLRGKNELPPRWITRGALGLWALLIAVWALRFTGLFGGPVPVTSPWS